MADDLNLPTQKAANEALLRQMAAASGGRLVRDAYGMLRLVYDPVTGPTKTP